MTKEIAMSRKQANDLHLDFKKSLIEQSKLVVEVFDKLKKIHTFIVGSLSFLYSSLFYGTVIICICTFRTMPSTAGARVSPFLILLIKGLAEYLVTIYTLHYAQAGEVNPIFILA